MEKEVLRVDADALMIYSLEVNMKARVKNICNTSGNRLLFRSDDLEVINELEEHYTIRWYRVGDGVLTDTIKKEYVEVIEE